MRSDSEKKRILLVDDDRDIHFLHQLVLKRCGFEVISAFSGEEGLELAAAHAPDVILLDYMMPSMNGEEVLEKLWSDAAYAGIRHIPVIMLTATSRHGKMKQTLLERGLAAYLEKPFREHELRNVIENVVVKHRHTLAREEVISDLQQSHEFFDGFLDTFPGVVFTATLEGDITFISRSETGGETSSGESQAALSDLFIVQDLDIESVRSTLEHEERYVIEEIFMRNGDSGVIPVELTLSLYKNRAGETLGLLGIARDRSVQKRLEHERLERERVTTVAQAMATVNHEINNPLTPVLGNLQLILAERGALPPDVVEKLESIHENARRIAASVQKMTTISQPILTEYVNGQLMVDLDKSA